VFITRAGRHDRGDVQEFLAAQGWTADLSRGTTFFARDGGIIGCVRLVEVEPQTVVLDDMLVAEPRRGEGVGGSLLRAAMNSRGGTLYVGCGDDELGFYRGFGFAEVTADELPSAVKDYIAARAGDRRRFMKAR
jgi:N-acetylglutamate synthase-like GNAT family acetyltransferase